MLLSEIIKKYDVLEKINYFNHDISEITCDSREVFGKSLFFAVKGNNIDGNDYIELAVKRGAVVVVSEKPSSVNVCQIIVKDVKEAIAEFAYNFYTPKKKRVKVIGVVGTNGKTTTSYMIKSILECAGYKVGIIGTLGSFWNKTVVEAELTTPDAIGLSEILMKMANDSIDYAVMELSAHAIEQKRADKIKFEALAFTNCTHDHLDYFKTLEEYKRVKISAFTNKNCRFGVVNVDDATGREIVKNKCLKTFTYGLDNPSDVFAINVENDIRGVSFVMNIFDDVTCVDYAGVGKFNVYNALAAATVTSVLGINAETISDGLSSISCIPGRMEFVENFNGANVFIDYAHTPDGLENTLKSLKEVTDNRLIALFGCGGNRDKEKRPIMGEVAGKYADFTIITSDNPRYEEPFQIISEIESGLRKETLKYITIQNRSMAIGYALTMLTKGDTLLIAGKGAEEYQEIMGIKLKFNDKEEVREIIGKIKLCGELI